MKVQAGATSFVAIALLALELVGCGWTLRAHQPDYPIRAGALPAFYRLDLEASSVEYRGNNEPVHAEALEVRNAVGELLRARARTVGPDRRPAPAARFRAVLEVSRTVWPLSWTIVCADLQPFGCPTGQAHATATIEVQVGSDMYLGRGTGSAIGGLYYNAFTGVPSAIEEAFEEAIEALSFVGRISEQPLLPYGPPAMPAVLPNGAPRSMGGGI
jgi:hypothetical protein